MLLATVFLTQGISAAAWIEPNVGQSADEYDYVIRAKGLTALVAGQYVDFLVPAVVEQSASNDNDTAAKANNYLLLGTTYSIDFVGTAPDQHSGGVDVFIMELDPATGSPDWVTILGGSNDGIVNFIDVSIFASVFLTSDEDADLNGDGNVAFLDFVILRNYFLLPSGPGPGQTSP